MWSTNCRSQESSSKLISTGFAVIINVKDNGNRLLNKLGSWWYCWSSSSTAGWRGPPWISVLSWWNTSTHLMVLELWVATLSCVKGTVHPNKKRKFNLLSAHMLCLCVFFFFMTESVPEHVDHIVGSSCCHNLKECNAISRVLLNINGRVHENGHIFNRPANILFTFTFTLYAVDSIHEDGTPCSHTFALCVWSLSGRWERILYRLILFIFINLKAQLRDSCMF